MIFLFKVPVVETVVGRINFVLEQCHGKKVLHLGCADEGFTNEKINKGNLLHLQISNVAKETWGVDYSQEAIEFLKKNGFENLFIGDIEQLGTIKKLKGEEFDVILLTEVLEHLNNPGASLLEIKKLFSPKTRLIITVPNGLSFTRIKPAMKGYESVHPDHNYWFSFKTLETLLRKNGYSIEKILVYTSYDYSVPIHQKIVEKINSLKNCTDSSKIQSSQKKNTSLEKQRTFMEKISQQLDLTVDISH